MAKKSQEIPESDNKTNILIILILRVVLHFNFSSFIKLIFFFKNASKYLQENQAVTIDSYIPERRWIKAKKWKTILNNE